MVNNLHANAGDTKNMGLTPGSGKSLGEGNDNLLQYSCLENPMNRGAWGATVHGAIKSWRRLRDCTHTYSVTFGKTLQFSAGNCLKQDYSHVLL